MIPLEKPGSPEEIVHFGVKGMKWGVRRTKGTKAFKEKFPTATARATEIERARESVKKTKTAYKSVPKGEQRQKLKDVHLKNPDRATALRLTRGEKIVAGLLYAGTPSVALPVGVAGFTLSRVGRRRAIED